MIIKTKKRKVPIKSNWLIFFIILLPSTIITYYLYNNSFFTLRAFKSLKISLLLYFIDIKFYLTMIILLFNFGNIYQTLILFYNLLIPQSIYILIKSITDINLKENIFYDFFLYFLFCFALGQFIFLNEDKIYNKIFYAMYIGFIIGFLFLIANTLAIINYSYILINKIISGFFIAISCYYFIFKVLNINHSNGLQLYNFAESINNNILVVFLFVLIIIIIYLKIYNISFIIALYFLNIIIPLVGIKYEITIIFKGNKMNWKNYNFPIEEEEDNINNINNNINMNNLISKIKITKSIKWNKTSLLYHILRLIFLFFVFIIISYFSSKIENKNISLAFLFLCFSIFLFILSKVFMKWMELINMTYFFLESDSINS